MLENRMILDEPNYKENYKYDDYLEYLAEENDRRYEDKIFERMSEN